MLNNCFMISSTNRTAKRTGGNTMKDYSKIFEADDIVFIHFHDVNGREFKTRDYGHPHPVYEENGKTGVYFGEGENKKFTPFESFAHSVTFERAL